MPSSPPGRNLQQVLKAACTQSAHHQTAGRHHAVLTVLFAALKSLVTPAKSREILKCNLGVQCLWNLRRRRALLPRCASPHPAPACHGAPSGNAAPQLACRVFEVVRS